MSEYYKGIYSVVNSKKYIGPKSPTFRSSWELRAMIFFDQNVSVLKWASEYITIPYFYEVDKRIHNYVTDFYAEIQTTTGQVKKYIIEVKPKKKLNAPNMPKRRTPKALNRFSKLTKEYVMNACKWKAAQEFCNRNGLEFKILTEEDIL